MTSPLECFPRIDDFLAYWLERPHLPKKEQQVFDTYYSSYHRHFGPCARTRYVSQVKEVEEQIRYRSQPRVLDVGCGCGTESIWFGILGASVLAIDIQKPRLEVAQSRLEHARNVLGLDIDVIFAQESVFNVSPDDAFDVIWLEQTFHHVEPREEFMQIIYERTAHNGCVVISETNGLNPAIQLSLLAKRGVKTKDIRHLGEEREHLYGVERITFAKILEAMMRNYGWHSVQYRHFGMLPNRSWADKFVEVERRIPRFLWPMFTHYNLIAFRK